MMPYDTRGDESLRTLANMVQCYRAFLLQQLENRARIANGINYICQLFCHCCMRIKTARKTSRPTIS